MDINTKMVIGLAILVILTACLLLGGAQAPSVNNAEDVDSYAVTTSRPLAHIAYAVGDDLSATLLNASVNGLYRGEDIIDIVYYGNNTEEQMWAIFYKR